MNKLKSTTLALGTLAAVAAPVAAVVSCGSNGSTDLTKIRVAYEKSWAPIIKKTLGELTPEEQAKFELVEIEDGKSVDYLDQVTIKPTAGATADIFASPVDHFSGLVDGGVVLDLGTNFPDKVYTADSIGKIGGKHYAFPINTESVIQIFNKNKASGVSGGVTTLNKETGFSSLKAMLDEPTSASQWGNLWVGSAALNAALVPAADETAAGKNQSTVADKWVKKDVTSWTAPLLQNADFKVMAEALFNKNNALRASSNAEFENIANNVERDANIRKNLISGDISGVVDGPWIINDLVARAVLANAGDINAMKAAIDNIGVSALPTIGKITGVSKSVSADVETSHMRHFNGGWGYAINRQKLGKMDKDSGSAKTNLEVKFLKLLTNSTKKTDWFKAGGKISAADGGSVKLDQATVAAMKLGDPTQKDHFVTLPNDADFTASLSDLYTRVISSVADQANFNVDQPSGKGWGLWDSWDKNGLSAASITTPTDFWTSFTKNVNNVLQQANA